MFKFWGVLAIKTRASHMLDTHFILNCNAQTLTIVFVAVKSKDP
jgi:hypothetical protein